MATDLRNGANTCLGMNIGSTPIRPPHHLLTYVPDLPKVKDVAEALNARDNALQLLKDNLHLAQDRMKKLADIHRTDREFVVEDWVFLKLQPYRQITVGHRRP